MSQEFKEGDVVVLKSGGPDMTYVGDEELGEAMCVWFEKNVQKSGNFPKIALKIAPPKSGNVSITRS